MPLISPLMPVPHKTVVLSLLIRQDSIPRTWRMQYPGCFPLSPLVKPGPPDISADKPLGDATGVRIYKGQNHQMSFQILEGNNNMDISSSCPKISTDH